MKTFVIGLLRLNSVGVEPLLRSAITPAVQLSASVMAAVLLIPRFRFWLYRARTRLPAVNWSIYSIGEDMVADAFCAHVRTSGSLPLRLVRKADASTMPSFSLKLCSVCHMPRSSSPRSSIAPPCVSGMKLVSHDAGLMATMLAATRLSSPFTRLYMFLPSACSMLRSARLFLLASRLVYSSSSTTKFDSANRPSS